MARGRTENTVVTRVDPGLPGRHVDDALVVEEPLAIRLDGVLVTTTMRTPGHDAELAVGFCFTEGLLAGAPVTGVAHGGGAPGGDAHRNVVDVETGGRAPTPRPRLGTTSSSCGWCGSDQIDDLTLRLEVRDDPPVIDADLAVRLPDLVLDRQELFASTGAVHAAAAFDATGAISLVREDVGRHNAVDKVVGAMVLDPTAIGEADPRPHGLFVSGRASIEMVQKAWAGGFELLVSVSAPTALAVQAARRANLGLVGFLRNGSCNVYSPGG